MARKDQKVKNDCGKKGHNLFHRMTTGAYPIKLTLGSNNGDKQIKLQKFIETQKQLVEHERSAVELRNNVVKMDRFDRSVGV